MQRVSANPQIEPLRFSLLPVFFAALCFACGIAVVRFQWTAPGLLLTAIILCTMLSAIAALKGMRASTFAVAVVFFLLGSFCAETAPAPDPQKHLRLLTDEGQQTVEGVVTRLEPMRHVEVLLPFSSNLREELNQRMRLQLTSVMGDDGSQLPLNGGLSLSLYAPPETDFPTITCGNSVRVTLEMHSVERYLDAGVWDERTYMLNEGIGAIGSTKLSDFAIVHAATQHSFSCWLHSIQQRASTRLIVFAESQPANIKASFFRLDREDATMLTAMLTGDRSYLSRGVRTGFERTGSFHLLVVSGLHLAIFASLIFYAAKLLRLPRVAATFATIVLSLAYALFTGYGQPVQRSFWMITLFLIGRLLWRERTTLNAIGFAALGLLTVNPHALFDAGFQMTLLSVLAIAGIAAPIAEKTFAPYLAALRGLWILPIDAALPPPIAQFRVSVRLLVESLRFFVGGKIASCFPFLIKILLHGVELILISIIVECVMSLPMALYFHRITIAALPVNLFVMPLIGILLPSAIATLLVILIAPAVAAAPAAVTAFILHAVLYVVRAFSANLAGDIRIPGPVAATMLLWMLFIAFTIWVIRRQRFAIAAAALSLTAAAAVVVFPHAATYRHGALEVTTIDVGQGDSLLIVSPEGKTLLVDGGGLANASPDAKFDIGEDVVSQLLWSRGIRRLDAVAITHCHADHIGGIPAILANFHPRELWIGMNPESAAYGRILNEASTLGITLKHHAAGDSFPFGSADVRVLAPEPSYEPKSVPTNDDSLVMRIGFGKTSAILEGDAEAPSEALMVGRGGLHSDLLKVGHHGSKTSTTPAFLQAVSPEYAAISAGRHNFYGHPKYETLERLQAAHALTYRTDLLGASTFYLDGTHVTATSWNSPVH